MEEYTDDHLGVYIRFSSDEKNELRHALKGVAPPEAIEAFIAGAEDLCGRKSIILMAQPTPAETRAGREKLLGDCRKAQKTLGRFAAIMAETRDEVIHISRSEDIVDWGPGFYVEHEIFMEAMDIYYTLEKFIEKLEKFQRHEEKKTRKQGRPEGDQDRFIRSIKWVYEEYIAPATLYEDGPFFQVVRLALKFVGLPYEYPTKSIRAAMKGAAIDLKGTRTSLAAGLAYIEQTHGTEQEKKAFINKEMGYHKQRMKEEDEKAKDLLTLMNKPTE